MASYANFQSNNAKYSRLDTRNNHNPDFNSNVSAVGVENKTALERNMDKYIKFASWLNWYPDLFLDLITPEEGGIKLHADQRIYLRCILRFFSLYGVFPRGWSKCVSGETILYTKDGLKEIGEFFNYIKTGKEFYITQSIDLINKNGVLENSNKGVYSGYKDTKIIKTEEGYALEGTLNHPILIMNQNGDIEFKQMQDLQLGDYVVINRNNDLWGNNKNINLKNLESLHNLISKEEDSLCKEIKFPNIIDEDFGLLIGYLLSHGRWTKAISNKVKSIVCKKFNLDFSKIKYNNKYYVMYSEYLKKYLELIGLSPADNFDKNIPKCILTSDKSVVVKMLRGLFDVDASIDSTGLSICSISDKLLKQVQLILLNMGIVSKINKLDDFSAYHILSINGENLLKFHNEIGFSCAKKEKALNKIINMAKYSVSDIIPFQKNKITVFSNDAKEHGTEICNYISEILKGEKELTYSNLNELLNLKNSSSFEGYDHLLELQKTNYFFGKIETIEDSKNHVYDLQVPETNSFITNGFVSHNTYLEVLAMFIVAIRFPGIELALTAQTKENAAEILKDKCLEIFKHYPLLNNEVFDKKFSKIDSEITFVNGSKIDILGNVQSSKGQRRKRMNIEEAALLDDVTFQDALKPIVEVSRYTVGKLGIVNPEELNQQINFFTTSGFRGSDEFYRSLQMIDNMTNLNGEMVLGSDWHLGCWYGRGSTKSQILQKKKTMSPIAFAQNYESKWVGSVDGALININKLLKLRTLTKSKIKGENDKEYVLGVDVARSAENSNNRSSVVVCEIKRGNSGKIVSINIVNIIDISNSLNFTSQAVEVKRIKKAFHAKMTIVDSNGLGIGLVDELMKESFDPVTGESLGCWNTINTEAIPEIMQSEKCLYDLKPQSANSDIIVSFIDMVESGKLRLLEKKQDVDYDLNDKENYIENVLPFVQTNFLIEEVANLQMKHLSSGKLSLEKVIRKINKDRFSALSYALWYIKTFEEHLQANDVDDYDLLMQYTFL